MLRQTYKLLGLSTTGLVLSAALFLLVNALMPEPNCADCFARRGWPFAFYHEGGFAGGAGYMWWGVIGDAFVVLLASGLIAFALDRLIARRPGPPSP